MFHLGAPPTVIRVASLYQIFQTASAAGSDPAGEPSRGYAPDMMRAIDAWRANAGVSAADPVPHSPPTQPSTSTGPSRITRRVLQPKQIAVKPSPLRPQCAGARRFETWTPPASAPSSSSLPTDLEKQTRAVAVAGLADSTKEKYSIALASWHAYCDRYHVSEHRRTPAEQCLVEHWIASEAGSQSGKYISNKVSGLKAWHAVNNVPWTLDEARLRLIKRGAVNFQPPPKPPRPPMTLAWLVKAIPVVEHSDPKEVAAIAAAACGFWGLCRIRELTVSASRFDPRYHATRTSVRFSHTAGGIKVLILRLPRTKTQPFGETVVLPARHLACDPVLLLQTHLAVSPSADPARTALFAYRHGRGHRVFTRSDLLAVLDTFARRADLRPLYGHSMRIGGCTALLLMGVPVDKVMMHGRWNGDSFKRYVRDHAEFLAPYLAVQQGALEALAGNDPELRGL
ncbi:hypothetical protein A4X06_0g9262 [Tilletia controversa]|uniref:Tyr recombinase domain-containing protein n=1 Tax=Tilletia controversa TaxID=13291 RepID=A0A8X7MIL1_9BASI|nr:hypothetical protein A4X06_0g9262 [Tilletia controversa]